MLAVSQSDGNVPVLSDRVKITCNTCDISSAHSFKINGERWSGPLALFTLRVESRCCIPSTEKMMPGVLGKMCSGFIEGIVEIFSLVKTEFW